MRPIPYFLIVAAPLCAQQPRGDQFTVWDKDSDGKLAPAELPEHLRPNFGRVDTDGDGFITPKEHRGVGIDPDKIAVWGSSAGGHLVSMLGTSGGVKELEGELGEFDDQSSRVTCVVSEEIHAALQKVGVESHLVRVEGAGHGFAAPEVEQRVKAFLSKHLTKATDPL